VRASTIVMIGFAVLFGLLAVFLAQTWLNNQAEMRMRSLEANKKPEAPAHTIVLAGKPLRYGDELTAASLREVAWPDGALPTGAFARIADVTAGKRVVVLPINENEPVLASKITGPGQRATLSAVLQEGMKAVTIRVNDVEGVAGFVLPGDHVDVVLTRQLDKENATNDVVIENARVLAVDQQADSTAFKPAVVKAVTLEVSVPDAQKLSLASSVGTLSLLLRKAGEMSGDDARRITLSDLGKTLSPWRDQRAVTKVTVTRAFRRERETFKNEAFTVPVDRAGAQAVLSRRGPVPE
jgi:pilus assembly protein CpaB